MSFPPPTDGEQLVLPNRNPTYILNYMVIQYLVSVQIERCKRYNYVSLLYILGSFFRSVLALLAQTLLVYLNKKEVIQTHGDLDNTHNRRWITDAKM